MMRQLMNAHRGAAAMAGASRARVRHGIVTGYNPASYAAKVLLQPDNTETGWLPVQSIWIGNSWGLFCPPSIGDAVEVVFQEDDTEAGVIGMRFFNDEDRPLAVLPGEFWLVHQSGSFLKFSNDGSVSLHSAAGLTATVAGDATVAVGGNINSSASQWNHSGPVQINGPLMVTSDITSGAAVSAAGNVSALGGDITMSGMRTKYDEHTHDGSSAPVPQM